MKRDSDIKEVFEIADDSLQGVLGYHFYVIAMQKSVDGAEKIMKYLPDEVIPHTFNWVRNYQKQDLIDTMKRIFELYQSRISLIAMVSVFEVVLENFVYHLNKKGRVQTLDDKKLKNENYKTYLKWAYSICDFGDHEAISRLPKTFGKIDNARRLRNLIVHNQGLFKRDYKDDAISYRNIELELRPDYEQFKNNQQCPIPLQLTTEDIINFSRAHVEVLHVLHNSIQKKFFGCPEPYGYLQEEKGIEWDKVLWGKK